MRHFTKSPSPIDFENWKVRKGNKAKYDNIPKVIKDDLKQSLINEQNGLCCYCGIRITLEISHIEHFKPQSDYEKQALDYMNLHASCEGKKNFKQFVEKGNFCGHGKGNWYDSNLLVSPLDPNCESYFSYTFGGAINENDSKAAKITIEKLQLDKYLLREQRKAAISAIMDNINIEDAEEIVENIKFLEHIDSDGNLNSFSFVVSKLLKSLIT